MKQKLTALFPVFGEYMPEIQEHIITNYGGVLLLCTEEQALLIMRDAATEYTPVDWYASEVRRLCHEAIEFHYAALQFPCKAVSGDNVRAHVRNRVHDMYTARISKVDSIIASTRVFYGYDLMDQLQTIKKSIISAGEDTNRRRWDAVKADMYPDHLWLERISNDHAKALAMNAAIDKAANIEAALSMLPLEQQELLRKELK